MLARLNAFLGNIEGSKLACDTGGHFTNYPTWPLPRTNPNVDVLNNALNYYALADLILYRLSVNIKHITMFTDVLAVTPHITDYLLPFEHISRCRSSCSVPAQLLQRYG